MVRIKKILCPIDFSDFSHRAFDRAVAIARSHTAALTVLHVVPVQLDTAILPYVEPESLGPFALPDVDRGRIVRELQQFLAIDHSLGVPVAFEVTEAPHVHEEILLHAERLPADLVVMGTHGRSGFQRLMLGSVTEKVLRKTRPPVLTVPRAVSDVIPAGRTPFERVLCAVDFSECSIAAFRYAVALAKESHARLAAVHVVELAPPLYDPLVGPAIDLPGYRSACEIVGRERLRNVIPVAVRKATGVEEFVACGKPHHEILRVAEEWRSDLIVLGVHGRNVADRMLFGSTVEPVVRRAPCPVLTVRAEARAASAAA